VQMWEKNKNLGRGETSNVKRLAFGVRVIEPWKSGVFGEGNRGDFREPNL